MTASQQPPLSTARVEADVVLDDIDPGTPPGKSVNFRI